MPTATGNAVDPMLDHVSVKAMRDELERREMGLRVRMPPFIGLEAQHAAATPMFPSSMPLELPDCSPSIEIAPFSDEGSES